MALMPRTPRMPWCSGGILRNANSLTHCFRHSAVHTLLYIRKNPSVTYADPSPPSGIPDGLSNTVLWIEKVAYCNVAGVGSGGTIWAYYGGGNASHYAPLVAGTATTACSSFAYTPFGAKAGST